MEKHLIDASYIISSTFSILRFVKLTDFANKQLSSLTNN